MRRAAILIVALTSGNIGTLIRHRSLALLYLIWLSALGAHEGVRLVIEPPSCSRWKEQWMAIVDERGRLFGRFNLLDAVLLVLFAGLVPLGYAAYALFREQPPRLVSVTPDRAPQSAELTLTLKGENLRPYMRVSAGTYQARDFVFKSTTEIEAPFADLPPGVYDIVLYDQAQERVRLPKALTVAPSELPPTEIVAVGAFGNLDAAGAAKLTRGTELPGAGQIVSVGKAAPDLTRVFAAPGLVGVPIANALRAARGGPVSMLRAHAARPARIASSATPAIAPTNLMILTTPLGKTPFQIEHVRSPHPLEPVAIEVRLTGHPAALSLIRPGDVDLGGTANELAADRARRAAGNGPPIVGQPG